MGTKSLPATGTGTGICPYYGRGKQLMKACAKCKISRACREAVDIQPLLRPQTVLADHDIFLEELSDKPACRTSNMDEKRYTLGDLLHLVRVMAAMDDITLMYLDEVFEHGCGMFFADLARKRGISCQAVHKKIKKEIAKFPELSVVFYPSGRPRWERHVEGES